MGELGGYLYQIVGGRVFTDSVCGSINLKSGALALFEELRSEAGNLHSSRGTRSCRLSDNSRPTTTLVSFPAHCPEELRNPCIVTRTWLGRAFVTSRAITRKTRLIN